MTMADDETVEKIKALAAEGWEFHPDEILALIARLEASQAEVKRMRDALAPSAETLSFVFALLGADTPDEARNIWMRNKRARLAAHTEMQILRAARLALSPPSPDRDEVGG